MRKLFFTTALALFLIQTHHTAFAADDDLGGFGLFSEEDEKRTQHHAFNPNQASSSSSSVLSNPSTSSSPAPASFSSASASSSPAPAHSSISPWLASSSSSVSSNQPPSGQFNYDKLTQSYVEFLNNLKMNGETGEIFTVFDQSSPQSIINATEAVSNAVKRVINEKKDQISRLTNEVNKLKGITNTSSSTPSHKATTSTAPTTIVEAFEKLCNDLDFNERNRYRHDAISYAGQNTNSGIERALKTLSGQLAIRIHNMDTDIKNLIQERDRLAAPQKNVSSSSSSSSTSSVKKDDEKAPSSYKLPASSGISSSSSLTQSPSSVTPKPMVAGAPGGMNFDEPIASKSSVSSVNYPQLIQERDDLIAALKAQRDEQQKELVARDKEIASLNIQLAELREENQNLKAALQ